MPIAFFAIYPNFFLNAQTGIRYELVVFPFLHVFSGSLLANWRRLSVPARLTSIALVLYLAFSVLSYFPKFTPYLNEVVLHKTRTCRYLSDSNLEWGQSQDYLGHYLSEHPEAVYNPEGVQAGRLVVGGSDWVGILEDPARYARLRDSFGPVDNIACCYLVFEFATQELADTCPRSAYCR